MLGLIKCAYVIYEWSQRLIYVAKPAQTHELTCPMPDDGVKLQVCSWRSGDEGEFKTSFKKSHGRIT